MAITNPQALQFTALARKLAQIRLADYASCKDLVNDWFGQSMSNLISNDATVVSDGAGTGGDGRPVVTGAMVTNAVTRAQDVITDLEAGGNAKLNTLLNLVNMPQSQLGT